MIKENDFGNRLREFKSRVSISNEELSSALDVSMKTCSQYLNNKSYPSIIQIESLKQHFPKLNLNWLIYGEGEMLTNYPNQDQVTTFQIQGVVKGGKLQSVEPLDLTSHNNEKYSSDANQRLMNLVDQLIKDNEELKSKVIRLAK